MLRLLCCLFCGLLFGPVASALAWADAGHKIIASIAFRQLTPAEREKIVAILKAHPRFAEDYAANLPAELTEAADQQEWHFQQAAVWPDYIRGYPEDLKPIYHHGFWHWITARPRYLTPADRAALDKTIEINSSLDPPEKAEESMNIMQALRHARRTLNDPKLSARDRALAVPWLFHLAGDIHQPLHSTSLYSRRLLPTGDRGGNSILTQQRSNLHAVWDQLPGDKLEFREAKNRALTLLNDVGQRTLGETAGQELNESIWLDESFQLATALVYDATVIGHVRVYEDDPKATQLEPLTLPESYFQSGGHAAKTRLVQAGYRLGAVLKEITAKSP